MKKLSVLAFTLLLVMGAMAQDASVAPQKKRIKQGVRSGELTRHETRKLVKQKKELREDVAEARADGTVTAGEKATIKQERRKVSRSIYRKKHNRRDRN